MLIAYRVPHGLLKKIRVTKEVYTDIYMQMTRHLTPFLLLLVETQTGTHRTRAPPPCRRPMATLLKGKQFRCGPRAEQRCIAR